MLLRKDLVPAKFSCARRGWWKARSLWGFPSSTVQAVWARFAHHPGMETRLHKALRNLMLRRHETEPGIPPVRDNPGGQADGMVNIEIPWH